MTARIRGGFSGALWGAVGLSALAGCGAPYEADAAAELDVGMAEQALADCDGDDDEYDFNAYAASLAIAVANELGRWDASADFAVINGKLELSTTGNLLCGTGCGNIKAILRLQDDATSDVEEHSPKMFREKLVSWHKKEGEKLAALVGTMLRVDKGIYKFKARHSGKYLAVDGSSTSDGARIEQHGSVSQVGADQWRLKLEGTKHKFVNVRSGKCMALSSDSSENHVLLVQKTCSTSTTQEFELAETENETGAGYYSIRTKFTGVLDVRAASRDNDAEVAQYRWIGPSANQQWSLEAVGTGVHISPKVVAKAMYHMTFKSSGKTLSVDMGSLNDDARIEQFTYTSSDDRGHWYIMPVGDKYQVVNRRSGKCLALASDNATSALVQKTCANVASQHFVFNPTGDNFQVIYSRYNKPLEVQGNSTAIDARIIQGTDTSWKDNRMIRFTPILAGEPHRLEFSHTSPEAECGDYHWYDIAQPNGQPLLAPADSYVQLIFAGGKETPTGKDVNPFIAQQVNGNKVAIDPTYGLNEGVSTTTGSCTYANIVYDPRRLANAKCCITSEGDRRTFKPSAWSTTTFICK